MDLHMPQRVGFEAARALQQALGERFLPIVALTGAATLTDRAQALKAGMCGFITKPIDAAQLPLEVLRALRGPISQAPSEPNTPAVLRSPPPGWPRLAGLDTADAAERLLVDTALFARLFGQLEEALREGRTLQATGVLQAPQGRFDLVLLDGPPAGHERAGCVRQARVPGADRRPSDCLHHRPRNLRCFTRAARLATPASAWAPARSSCADTAHPRAAQPQADHRRMNTT